MKLSKSILAIATATLLFASCENNDSSIENESEISSQLSDDLTQDDLTSVVETLSISYPITTVNDNGEDEIITSDEELNDYGETTNEPKIEFPITITINGEEVIIESKKELMILFNKRKHRRFPLHLVFPINIINSDETTTVIEDREAMKAYRETLEEGVKPAFEFPISIEEKDETVVEIESQEDLEAYFEGKKPEKK
ncbi:hypothetical protein FHR24_000299 [Wenyingzhuangia heitensis]|uniref:Lipoprotein n=1 Tax=Wenyingzhuangia heitensis TaxID=1487859 RepID=A0ABX0U4T2_9FLAO|nr:hypothetical protein [Wenyingzhuangia heitensis]NIJ43860.1 hypothetical protein [Wenyingzhuangia heitensis]